MTKIQTMLTITSPSEEAHEVLTTRSGFLCLIEAANGLSIPAVGSANPIDGSAAAEQPNRETM